mmetsp:Transcript_10153/g.21388  ORF Transcript_10153/g.21388 Transcript_10153/m.21388 type:complete len:81 (+) Transcript_10153:155-397(+)
MKPLNQSKSFIFDDGKHPTYEPQVRGFERNKILSSPISLLTNLAQYAVPVFGAMVAGRVAYNSKNFPFKPTNKYSLSSWR